jgi:hypothetical protein
VTATDTRVIDGDTVVRLASEAKLGSVERIEATGFDRVHPNEHRPIASRGWRRDLDFVEINAGQRLLRS